MGNYLPCLFLVRVAANHSISLHQWSKSLLGGTAPQFVMHLHRLIGPSTVWYSRSRSKVHVPSKVGQIPIFPCALKVRWALSLPIALLHQRLRSHHWLANPLFPTLVEKGWVLNPWIFSHQWPGLKPMGPAPPTVGHVHFPTMSSPPDRPWARLNQRPRSVRASSEGSRMDSWPCSLPLAFCHVVGGDSTRDSPPLSIQWSLTSPNLQSLSSYLQRAWSNDRRASAYENPFLLWGGWRHQHKSCTTHSSPLQH